MPVVLDNTRTLGWGGNAQSKHRAKMSFYYFPLKHHNPLKQQKQKTCKTRGGSEGSGGKERKKKGGEKNHCGDPQMTQQAGMIDADMRNRITVLCKSLESTFLFFFFYILLGK